ncbi:carboxypeptidase-like regulatory domain-containing protein [Marinifilum sp.]|uniref:STN domain-containing protein n=1 Tax=Marinifilum sp. TaxID=2033137 RepID=UPI003BAD988F
MNKNRFMMKFFGLLLTQRISVKSALLLCMLFIGLLHTQAATYVQNEKVTLKLKEQTVEEVFEAISKQTDYKFFYNHNQLDLNRKLSVNVADEPVKEVLEQVLIGTNCEYQLYEKQIIITDKKSTPKEQQQKSINGKVTDKNGVALPGVSVLIKGSYTGTATNMDGFFNISVEEGTTLVFSFVGMATQEVLVENQKNCKL